jgi:RHS repeat-associated protein
MALTEYIWDELNDSYLIEVDEVGATTAVYTTEPVQYGGLVSHRRDNAAACYHFDGQHSTWNLTDMEQVTTDDYTYSAFGDTVTSLGTTNTPFGYNGLFGYYAQSASHYIRSRTYVSPTARWLSSDPLSSPIAQPPSGGYIYADNNPVIRSDPSGLLTARVDQDPLLRSVRPCGGYKARLYYNADKVRNDIRQIVYVQRICIYLGSASCCVYGAPPHYGCECGPLAETQFTECCFYEWLGTVVDRRADGSFPEEFDEHEFPPITRDTCSSMGAYLVSAQVRAFEATLATQLELNSWIWRTSVTCNAGLDICNRGQGASIPVGGSGFGPIGKTPSFWNNERDSVDLAVRVDWNCCDEYWTRAVFAVAVGNQLTIIDDFNPYRVTY